ncbi:MAG: NAD-dependent dehydratase, partial [Burkholderiales bacterium]|nr:NAD-dependent dehydratase [Burkholderiales bacterium]
LRVLGPVLPRRWRINPAPRIASALLEAALAGAPGVHGVSSEQLA